MSTFSFRSLNVDSYEVVQKIGSGGFCDVFLIRDPNSGKQLVLKEYYNCRNVNRLYNEIQILTQLNSIEGYLYFYGYAKVNDKFCLCLDYAQGGTLKEYINRKGVLGEEETIEIIKQILTILRFAHQQSIIHLDIKASNVLIHKDTYLLHDWGISKYGNNIPMFNIKGDAKYIAPETYVLGRVSQAYDIYSLGCLLYHMLTGEELHTHHYGKPIEKIYALTQTDVIYPISISPSMQYLLDQMLCKDPEKRVQIDDLYDYLMDTNPPIKSGKSQSQGYSTHRFKNLECFYLTMAEQGYVYVQNLLALEYEKNHNIKQAMFWYSKASEKGFALAQYNLGRLYLTINAMKAYEYFHQAALQGLANAQYGLSQLYLKGEGTRYSPTEASYWLQMAQKNGFYANKREESNSEFVAHS